VARLHRRHQAHRAADPSPTDPEAQEQAGRILSGLDDLRHTPVRDVMTPRVDVVGLPVPVTASDLARAVRQSGHSTFPVYDDDLDNLVGVLYARDLFRSGWAPGPPTRSDPARSPTGAPRAGDGGPSGSAGTDPKAAGGGATPAVASGGDPTAPAGGTSVPPTGATAPVPPSGGAGRNGGDLSPLDISRRIRKPYVVPESKLVLDVLASMRRDRRTFAVVVDEYGGVAGIATIKDLLAALVGDLRDEFDQGGEPDVVRVDRARWLVDGGVPVDELRDRLGCPVPDGEYVTLGGYLLDVTGHIPEEGERVRRDGWEYRVVEMDRRRIAKVVVKRLTPEHEAPDTTSDAPPEGMRTVTSDAEH
jgi:CBS domain containing-hemolysin-like protein